jgi:hypothetical protein
MLQFAAWQHVGPGNPASEVIEQWLPASPEHVFVPEHELSPQLICVSAEEQITFPPHELVPQPIKQLFDAVQLICEPHESLPQSTWQSTP